MINRKCPLCSSTKNSLIHTQRYDKVLFHKIVICKLCGFCFVKNTPSAKEYSTFYKNSSIYEYTRDEDIHEESVKFIQKNVPQNARILDVGSSTGNLLYLLKKAGYKKLLGIDPSPRCGDIAKKDYGVQVLPFDLQSFKDKLGFDLIILNNVLEHLPNVQESVQKLSSLLKKDGYLYIAVPDEGNCDKNIIEPFYEFSIEHINFFSVESLYYLLVKYKAVNVESDGRVIYSLWQKGGRLETTMKTYVKKSNEKLTMLTKQVIEKLPEQYLVWGAGSLTRRLLFSTKLRPFKIVDRNPLLANTRINGIQIILPDEVPKYSYPILVSSYRYKDEIGKYIKKTYPNSVIFLP